MAEALAPEVVPFSSEKIGIKNFSFYDGSRRESTCDLMPKNSRVLPAKRMEVLGLQSA